MHEVSIDRVRRRIRLTVYGFLQSDEITRLESDMKSAARELLKSGAQFDILADIRESQVLPPEEANRIGAVIKWLFEHGLRKNANLVTRTLLKMQINRMAGDSRSGYFDKEEEAIRWLDG